MTTFTLAPTEDNVFRELRAFLQDILPPQQTSPSTIPHVVIVGQENRVPEPKASNYVIMTPLRMPRLSTNFDELAGSGAQQGLLARTTQSAQVTLQLDIHGPEAFNNATRISTLFRNDYAVQFFADRGQPIAPLYADDPRQMPFAPGGEQQYEDRYIIEANLQVNFTMTAVAQSARALSVGLIDVETNPDHWPNSTATATGS